MTFNVTPVPSTAIPPTATTPPAVARYVAPVEVNCVVEAFPLNCWRAVKVLAWARLREATTAPVVGEIVRDESEFETEDTPVINPREEVAVSV